MFGFVNQVVVDFTAASALEKIGFLLSLTGFSTIFGVVFSVFRSRNSRALIDQLRQDVGALATERDEAERQAVLERERAEAWMPHQWMEQAEAARRAGDEDNAIAILETGFERVRIPLARTSLALAGYQLSLVVGVQPAQHLEAGERYARLSALLDPDDSDAAFLIEDAELARTSGDTEAIGFWPASFQPESAEELRALVSAVNSKAMDFYELGSYRSSLRLFRRSLFLVKRGGLARDSLGQLVRLKVAECLNHCGLPGDAFEDISELISFQESILPPHDEELFRSRIAQARAVEVMGDYPRALELMTDAISTFASVAGDDHEYTLAARVMQVGYLVVVGKTSRALGACRALLPEMERVYGPEHTNTLAARHQEAFVLANSGEWQLALDRIEVLLPIQARIWGADHPNGISTRQLEAECLRELGKREAALARIETLLLVVAQVFGADHSQYTLIANIKKEILDTQAQT